MKALMLTIGIGSGVDAVTNTFAREMNRLGHPTDVIYYWPGNNFKFRKYDGLETEFPVSDFNGLIQQVQRGNYDIIHSHSCIYGNSVIGNGNGVSRFVNETGSPFVYTVHSSLLNDKMQRVKAEGGKNLSIDEAIRIFGNDPDIIAQDQHMHMADKVTHLTNYGLGLMHRVYPRYDSKSAVVPNASDFHKFVKDPEVIKQAEWIKHNYAKGRKIILQPGFVVKTKGAFDTAMAFNEISKKLDAFLIFAGGYNPGTENELRSIVNNDLHGKYLLTGYIDRKEMAALYKAADIVVLPTYHESWGLVGTEALQMGTPFAVSDLEGPHEVFVKPSYALKLEAGNPKQIAKTVIDAFRHPKKLMEMTLKAQEAVTRMYNEVTVTNKLMRVYQDVVSSHTDAKRDLDVAELSIRRALDLDRESRHQQAIPYYKHCIFVCEGASQKSSSLRDARFKKGIALRNIGRLNDAAQAFWESIVIDPNHALSFYDKALTHRMAGNTPEYEMNMQIYESLKAKGF